MCLFRSYQRRSTTLAIVGSSPVGFGVQAWDVGGGDEGKSNDNPLGPIVRSIDDKMAEFKVLPSESEITKRKK